jgi:hypothetical protein
LVSEKARIPAWTDRILRKGTNIRQINYNTAPLRFSDHRPVYATFECTVTIVDESVREALSREIYRKRQSEVGTTTADTQTGETDDEDLIDYDSIEPGLPPPSSDRRKWWLDNSQPARSTLKPPRNGAIPNPNRPSNPYSFTDEPEWVTVPRMPAPQGTTQVKTSFTPPPPNRRLSTSSTKNGSRKLPPPFEPSLTSLNNGLSQTSLQDVQSSISKPVLSPPQHKDRRLSTSTNSSTSKGPPPAVARKPMHLTSSPCSTSSSTLSTISPASRAPQQPPQKPPQTSVDGFPPPPRKVGAGPTHVVGPSYGEREVEDGANAPPPLPQPRRSGKKGGVVTAGDDGPRPSLPPRPRDLLGDDVDELNGWEALKPS